MRVFSLRVTSVDLSKATYMSLGAVEDEPKDEQIVALQVSLDHALLGTAKGEEF